MTNEHPQAPPGTSAFNFFESMKRLGMEYAGATHEGGRFRCPYPGHEDGKPSLDVTIGRNGKPVLNCKVCEQVYGDDRDGWFREVRDAGVRFGGDPCRPEDVDWGERAALSGSRKVKGDGSERVNVETIRYDYNFANGRPNFRAFRVQWEEDGKPRKSFFVKRFVMGQGFETGFAPDTERTPYLLDQFEEWAATAGPEEALPILWLVEGEKAVHALLDRGKHATTFQGGAAAPLTEDWARVYGFKRFDVRVWPDADEAGVQRARLYVKDLRAAGCMASVWGIPADMLEPKDDAYDVLKRKQGKYLRRLSATDAKAYAALNPLPTRSANLERRAVSPVEAPKSITVGGKTLVSASGAVEADSGSVVTCGGDSVDDPYNFAVNVEPYLFASEMLDRHFRSDDGVLTLRFRHDDRTFWLWSNRSRRYEFLSEDEVKAHIASILAGAKETTDDGEIRPVKVKARTYAEVVENLRVLTLTSQWGAGALLPSVGGVPFRNGWLNVESGELETIGPERDVRWNVPVDYTDDAQCPEWLKFLRSLGWTRDTDEYRLLRQWYGYLLSGSKDQEKALLMLGPSRAGKGTVIRVAMALLGEGATGTSLESLISNFGLQNFIGKGLATIGDARFGRSDKGMNARLLSLTSNDELPVDVKYGKPLSINLPVRLMIATNETPNFIEASDALARRFVSLVFEKSFADNPDFGLFKRLRSELPGIARWALGGLADLNEQGKFTETASGKGLQKQMIQESAFVRIFVEECCVLEPNAKVVATDLYTEYALWAAQNNMPVFNSVRFGRELSDAYPGSIETGVTKKAGKSVRVKIGVKLA